MKVNHSGRIKVSTYVHGGGFVGLDIIHGDNEMPANMTAAKARKLARKLLAAADEIDPPAIAPTHWAAEPSATLAPIVATDEPAVALAFTYLDVVDVRAGNGSLARPGRAMVVAVQHEPDGDTTYVVQYDDGLRQYIGAADAALVSPADAPEVDPAEPRGGCCGGGC